MFFILMGMTFCQKVQFCNEQLLFFYQVFVLDFPPRLNVEVAQQDFMRQEFHRVAARMGMLIKGFSLSTVTCVRGYIFLDKVIEYII